MPIRPDHPLTIDVEMLDLKSSYYYRIGTYTMNNTCYGLGMEMIEALLGSMCKREFAKGIMLWTESVICVHTTTILTTGTRC